MNVARGSCRPKILFNFSPYITINNTYIPILMYSAIMVKSTSYQCISSCWSDMLLLRRCRSKQSDTYVGADLPPLTKSDKRC